jgi:hypothetical protein
VFDNWSQWTWVSIAWIELVLAYGGYLLYLNWRRQKVIAEHAEETPQGGRR